MKFLNYFKRKKEEVEIVESSQPDVRNNNYNLDSCNYGPNWAIVSKTWDGEKTTGELGVVVKNMPDFLRLRLRAYDAQMKIDIINVITGRYFKWVIGNGLKLQSEPNKTILEMEGISLPSMFSEKTEARFKMWANSKYASYDRQGNLHSKALECFGTSFLGGDSLVICRFDELGLNVQVVDGQHVKTPGQDLLDEVKTRNNYEEQGIEFNDRGEHVAYFVSSKGDKKDFLKTEDFKRIVVHGEKTNRKLAWMVYGSKHRIDHKRGISRISHVLEKVTKLDRYTEATVSKAEQSANIVNYIEHNSESTGENPLAAIKNRKLNINGGSGDEKTAYELADGLANRIQQTTSNITYNMPIGSKMTPYQSNSENNYEAFQSAVFDGICSSVDMPPEVATQKYNSNYSASRAAINGWGYIIDIERMNCSNDFYKPIYALFLEWQVLSNKIIAPKYITSLRSEDYILSEAYHNCRFIGKNMPHIDPVKEVKAVVQMIENELITREQATELLNMGDWFENYVKKQEEDKLIPKPITEDGNTKNTGGK